MLVLFHLTYPAGERERVGWGGVEFADVADTFSCVRPREYKTRQSPRAVHFGVIQLR